MTHWQDMLIPMYYRGALGAIVVYDITRRETFEGVKKWFTDIKRFAEEIPVVLIGNKSDLTDERVVTYEEGRALAEEYDKVWSKEVFFKESSAKDAVEVNESFTMLAESILAYLKEEVDEDEFDFSFEAPF